MTTWLSGCCVITQDTTCFAAPTGLSTVNVDGWEAVSANNRSPIKLIVSPLGTLRGL